MPIGEVMSKLFSSALIVHHCLHFSSMLATVHELFQLFLITSCYDYIMWVTLGIHVLFKNYSSFSINVFIVRVGACCHTASLVVSDGLENDGDCVA